MEGRSVMLQASTLQSAPQGTRLGIRQYGCSLDGQNQGLLAQCSCPEAPETWETPTTSASTPQTRVAPRRSPCRAEVEGSSRCSVQAVVFVWRAGCDGHPSGAWGAGLWPESTNSSNPQRWLLPLPPVLPAPEPSALL